MNKLVAALLLLLSTSAFAQQETATINGQSAQKIQMISLSSMQVVPAVRRTGLTSSVTSTNLCSNTQCPAGLYMLMGNIEVSTVASLATFSLTAGFTDSVKLQAIPVANAISLASSTTQVLTPLIFYSNGTTAITYATTVGGTGTPTYNLNLVLIRLS